MIDLAIVLSFVIYSITVGFLSRKKASRGLEEYFLAGRSLKGWQSGLSMAATQYAADTPLLVMGLVATAGIFSLWRLWTYAIAFLFMGFVLGPLWRRARVLTDAEFTEIRYSGKGAALLRALKAIYLGTLVNCTILAMVLLAAARIAEPFLLWHEWLPSGAMEPVIFFVKQFGMVFTALPETHPEVWIRSADNLISIFSIVGFTTLYSMTGGLRSVVATDIVQFAIAMIATLLYAMIVVHKVGGLDQIVPQLESLYGAASARSVVSFFPGELNDVVWIFIIVISIQWFAQINADGSGYLAQRTMACQTDKDTRVAAVTFSFAQVLVRSLLWLPIAVGLLILYPAAIPPGSEGITESFRVLREGTFAQGFNDFLPVGVRGLMLTGMLAALASTLDTHLNWGASYWANDLYKRFIMEKFLRRNPGNRELVWVARASNLGILLLALFVMNHLTSIQSAWHISLLFGSGVGVVLILRWLWYRINLWSELTAVGASLILAPILLILLPETSQEAARMVIMVMTSTTLVIAVTLLTPPEPASTLDAFYTRVHPPGAWGPVARRCADSIRKDGETLTGGILSTLYCSLSIFMLLTGIGGWLVNPASSPVSNSVLTLAGAGFFFLGIRKIRS